MASTSVEAVIEDIRCHIRKYGGDPSDDAYWSRCELVESLEKFTDPDSVNYLISLVSEEDNNSKEYHQLKSCIVDVFYEIKSPLTLDVLISLAQDKNERISSACIETLGVLRDPKAIDVLSEVLFSGRTEGIRGEAAQALNLIRDPKSISVLTDFLVNVLDRVSEAGYHEGDYDPAQEAIQALAVIAEKMGGVEDQRAVEVLLKLLEFDSDDLGISIVSALGELRNESAAGPLLNFYDTLLSDEYYCGDIQEKVVRALGKIGGDSVKKRLFEDMDKPSHCGRSVFLRALAEAKDERILDELFEDLISDDSGVRNDASKALAGFGNALNIDRLTSLLDHENKGVRADAVWVLGESYNEAAVPYLIQALKDKHYRARAYAAEALGVMKDERAVDPLVEALKREIVVHEAALKKMPKEDSKKDGFELFEGFFNAIKILNNSVPHSAREEMIWAFRNMHNEEAFQLTLEHLQHENDALRMTAADVLGYMKDQRAVGFLEELIKGEEDEDVRDVAVKALGKISGDMGV